MGLFGGGGGTQKVDNRPWETQRHYLSRGFRGAEAGIFDRPLHYYPGRTVSPFAPQSRQAMNAIIGRAQAGNPLNPASQQQTMDTMSGRYLSGGDYYDDILDSVASGVRPGVESSFATSGRSGSALANEAVGRGVSRGMSPFLNAERQRMMQASAMAPQLAREDYYDMDRLGGVGSALESKRQQHIQDAMNRWDFAQNEPYTRMSRYMQLINSPIPGKVESSSGGGSTAGSALGGAASGAAMGSMLGPWGAVVGGGIGLMGGLSG